jgi:hypothetical protein
MEWGLLWYDDDPKRDLAEKVSRAAERYRRKFGESPNVCYVHPSLLDGEQPQIVGEIRVLPRRNTSPNYFWIGIEKGPSDNQPTAPFLLEPSKTKAGSPIL